MPTGHGLRPAGRPASVTRPRTARVTTSPERKTGVREGTNSKVEVLGDAHFLATRCDGRPGRRA